MLACARLELNRKLQSLRNLHAMWGLCRYNDIISSKGFKWNARVFVGWTIYSMLFRPMKNLYFLSAKSQTHVLPCYPKHLCCLFRSWKKSKTPCKICFSHAMAVIDSMKNQQDFSFSKNYSAGSQDAIRLGSGVPWRVSNRKWWRARRMGGFRNDWS